MLLDVDGVLADFVGAYLELLASELGIIAAREQIVSFDIAASLRLSTEQAKHMRHAIDRTPHFALTLEVLPGAAEGVARLQEIAELYIVTSPWNTHPTWTADREAWLWQHFRIPHRRVLHTAAKRICRGDFLVDDKTATLGVWQVENPDGIAIQWITPHNRLDGWAGRATDDWEHLIALVSAHGRLRRVEAGLIELREQGG